MKADSRFKYQPGRYRHHKGGGAFSFDIVGESYYQEALGDIAGGKVAGGHKLKYMAHLVPEPDNPYDSSAVAVHIDGLKVGHIPKGSSGRIASLLGGRIVTVAAKVIGGWREADGDEGNFGVRLDLDPELLGRQMAGGVENGRVHRARETTIGGKPAHERRASKAFGWLAVSAVGLVVAAALVGSPQPAKEGPEIEQVGYFKSPARDRVMAFHSDARLSLEQVCELWRGLPYTAGTIFRGVAYSGRNSAPADALTFAPDLRRALVVTITPPFDKRDWMFVVNPAGRHAFVGSDARCEWW